MPKLQESKNRIFAFRSFTLPLSLLKVRLEVIDVLEFSKFNYYRITLCDGSASRPRRIKVSWTANDPNNFISMTYYDEVDKSSPLLFNCSRPPFMYVSFH